MSVAFNALGRILLVSSAWAVELSVWMGVRVCGCPISSNVCLIETALLVLMNNALSLAFAAGDITALITCEILSTAPLLMGIGGPAQNLSNFQMAPIPFLSVLTCSTRSPHDILKVSLKNDWNLPFGCNKH